MGLTQKQRKIIYHVVSGIGAAIIIAGVIVGMVILFRAEDYCDKPAFLPTFLYVSENEGNVNIEWSETGFSCNGSYLLQYSINGGEQIDIRTTYRYHTVVKPPICSDMLIQLRTVGEAGRISEESLDRNYTVVPLNALVINTSIIRTDSGLVASWEKPTKLGTCDVNYAVKFTSELGQFDERTASQSIIVPEDVFCFNLRVQVSTVVGFSQTWLGDVGYFNAGKIVANLSIPSENPYVLVATWFHRNVDVCLFSYEVTYQSSLGIQTYVVSQPRVTFDIAYCTGALLTIIPSAFDGEHIELLSIMLATQNPDDIEFEPVENVTFALNELSMAVSWNIPDALSKCEDLYNVTAKNSDLNEEANCQGTNGCEVTLSSYCPSTDFIITPIGLQGETISETYSCI